MSALGKRIILWTVVLAVVGCGLWLAFAPRAIVVDLVTIESGPMVVTVEEEGETRIHDVYVLSAPVAGRIQRIDQHVGDPVIAGQTRLTRIRPGDPTFLDPRSEVQARAAVQAAESARELAAARVDQAIAELEFADSELVRSRELVVSDTISERAHDDAQRVQRTCKAALAAARAEWQMQMFELERAKAQLLSPVETQDQSSLECSSLPVRSPVSGRVLRIFNPSKRVVAAAEPLVEIGDPSELEIVVDFLSTDAVKVSPGQRVVIERWGGAQPLAARVRRVEPFGFKKVSALGIEEQRVNVIIDLVDEPEIWDRLGHGYQVEAQVVLWEHNDVLTIPLTALFRDDGHWAVFVEQAGRVRLRRVQLGRKNGRVAEVQSGLAAGATVVAHPSNRLLDGVRIAPRADG